jgi:hypothetical protein
LKKERSRKHRGLQLLRAGVQAVFLALFLWLLLGTHFTGEDYIGNVEAFFHFDPLLGVVAAIAGREVFTAFIGAAAILLLTVFLGRVVCGWACPLGAVHQFFSWLFKKTKLLRPRKVATGGLHWKYLVLGFILVAAVFSLDLAGYLDPLSFLTRTVTASLLPAFALAARMVIGAAYGLGLERIGDSLSQGIETMTVNAEPHPGAVLVPVRLPGGRAPRARVAGERLQAESGRRKMHQMQPLHDSLPDAGASLSGRELEELGMRLLRDVRGDLPDGGHHLPCQSEAGAAAGRGSEPTQSAARFVPGRLLRAVLPNLRGREAAVSGAHPAARIAP